MALRLLYADFYYSLVNCSEQLRTDCVWIFLFDSYKSEVWSSQTAIQICIKQLHTRTTAPEKQYNESNQDETTNHNSNDCTHGEDIYSCFSSWNILILWSEKKKKTLEVKLFQNFKTFSLSVVCASVWVCVCLCV